jgi:hypothetical protein
MNIGVDIDDSRFTTKLLAWMAVKNKTMANGMRTLAATVCRAFYEYTIPRDNVKPERQVMSDVYKVYATQGSVYQDIKLGKGGESAADAFWYFCTIGKWATARKIMQAESPTYGKLAFSKFDNGTLHKRMRDKRGRIAKGTSPKFVVQDRGKKNKLEAYVEKQRKSVGMAKAGWVQAWRGVGQPRNTPEWVNRHKSNLGTSSQSHTADKSEVTIWNQVRYAENAMPERYKQQIVNNAVARFVEYLDRQLSFK